MKDTHTIITHTELSHKHSPPLLLSPSPPLPGGSDCNVRDPQSSTALHLSASHKAGSHTLFTALMRAGADVNLQDAQERTVLHVALIRMRDLADAEAMASSVIACGRARLNLKKADGMTALHVAVLGDAGGHTSVAEQLIDHEGCDVDIAFASTGRTPLLMVVLQCKASLTDRLIKRWCMVMRGGAGYA